MSKLNLTKIALITAGVISSFALINTANAAGFQINEMSPIIQGTALAGAASATNEVTAMSYNPATLATLKRNQVYLGGSYIIPNIEVKNATATTAGTSVSGDHSEGGIAPAALIPDMYLGWDASQDVKVGLAVTVPWGLSTNYNNSWVGRNNALKSKIAAIDIAPTIAFKFNQYVFFGFAVHAQHMTATLTNTALSSAPSNGLNASLKGNDWAWGYSFGFLFKPFKHTDLGISYRSKISHDLKGNASVTHLVPLTNASAKITSPEVVDISVTQTLTPKWQVMGTAQWTRWSRFNRIDAHINSASVPSDLDVTNWQDSWLFSLGSAYKLTHKFTVRAGFAFDKTPTRTVSRDPRLPGTNRYWLTLGATYNFTRNLSVDGVFEHIFMNESTVNVTQYSAGFANHVSAQYSGFATIIGLGVRYKF